MTFVTCLPVPRALGQTENPARSPDLSLFGACVAICRDYGVVAVNPALLGASVPTSGSSGSTTGLWEASQETDGFLPGDRLRLRVRFSEASVGFVSRPFALERETSRGLRVGTSYDAAAFSLRQTFAYGPNPKTGRSLMETFVEMNSTRHEVLGAVGLPLGDHVSVGQSLGVGVTRDNGSSSTQYRFELAKTEDSLGYRIDLTSQAQNGLQSEDLVFVSGLHASPFLALDFGVSVRYVVPLRSRKTNRDVTTTTTTDALGQPVPGTEVFERTDTTTVDEGKPRFLDVERVTRLGLGSRTPIFAWALEGAHTNARREGVTRYRSNWEVNAGGVWSAWSGAQGTKGVRVGTAVGHAFPLHESNEDGSTRWIRRSHLRPSAGVVWDDTIYALVGEFSWTQGRASNRISEEEGFSSSSIRGASLGAALVISSLLGAPKPAPSPSRKGSPKSK